MSTISGFFEAFGFYTKASAERSQFIKEDEAYFFDGLNIGGYLPGVGVGTAIARWKFAYSNWSQEAEFAFNIGQIVRGILEFIGLGVVMGFLLDTSLSIYRHIPPAPDATYSPLPDLDSAFVEDPK